MKPPTPWMGSARKPATRPVVVARAIRAFADGFAAVLLARYLQHIGFDGFQIGVIVTATLLGSAALTLWAGLRLNRWGAQRVLFGQEIRVESDLDVAATGLACETPAAFFVVSARAGHRLFFARAADVAFALRLRPIRLHRLSRNAL